MSHRFLWGSAFSAQPPPQAKPGRRPLRRSCGGKTLRTFSLLVPERPESHADRGVHGWSRIHWLLRAPMCRYTRRLGLSSRYGRPLCSRAACSSASPGSGHTAAGPAERVRRSATSDRASTPPNTSAGVAADAPRRTNSSSAPRRRCHHRGLPGGAAGFQRTACKGPEQTHRRWRLGLGTHNTLLFAQLSIMLGG